MCRAKLVDSPSRVKSGGLTGSLRGQMGAAIRSPACGELQRGEYACESVASSALSCRTSALATCTRFANPPWPRLASSLSLKPGQMQSCRRRLKFQVEWGGSGTQGEAQPEYSTPLDAFHFAQSDAAGEVESRDMGKPDLPQVDYYPGRGVSINPHEDEVWTSCYGKPGQQHELTSPHMAAVAQKSIDADNLRRDYIIVRFASPVTDRDDANEALEQDIPVDSSLCFYRPRPRAAASTRGRASGSAITTGPTKPLLQAKPKRRRKKMHGHDFLGPFANYAWSDFLRTHPDSRIRPGMWGRDFLGPGPALSVPAACRGVRLLPTSEAKAPATAPPAGTEAGKKKKKIRRGNRKTRSQRGIAK